jgi:hypothetical protein
MRGKIYWHRTSVVELGRPIPSKFLDFICERMNYGFDHLGRHFEFFLAVLDAMASGNPVEIVVGDIHRAILRLANRNRCRSLPWTGNRPRFEGGGIMKSASCLIGLLACLQVKPARSGRHMEQIKSCII